MKIWFNKGLSNTFDVLTLIRAHDPQAELRLRASHTEPLAAIAQAADEFAVEPTALSEAEYVDWCLAQCLEHSIDLLVPHRQRLAIARQRQRFEAHGIALSLMGDAAIMALVERKNALYDDLRTSAIPLPPYWVFRSLADFDALLADHRDPALRLCVKPSEGIYGSGFRLLEWDGNDMQRLLAGDHMHLSVDAFRAALAGSPQEREMMLMVYLPGIERSVDVLAQRGRMVCAVARVKRGSHQVLETSGPSIDIAAELTARYQLDGLFNLQTKEWEGQPYLLEINSRMSGGLIYSCQAGVPLPYWAVRLALGSAQPEMVPAPVAGICVAPVQSCVRVA